jgi:hypothetical protein
MVRGLVLVSLLVGVTGLVGQQTATPVVSARLAVVREPTTDLLVHMTNLRDVPLAHYAVAFGTGSEFWYRSDGLPGNQAIAPGQTRTQRIDVADAVAANPRFVLLGYTDGYYEGERERLQQFFHDFGTPPGHTIAEPRPPIVPGRSARLRSEPVSGVRLVANLENLRSVPLEAWSLEEVGGGKVRSGHWSDTCGVPDSRSGAGAIQSRETRQVHTVSRLSPSESRAITVELRAVLYRDGHVEGRRDDMRGVFEHRTKRGLPCNR